MRKGKLMSQGAEQREAGYPVNPGFDPLDEEYLVDLKSTRLPAERG